MTKLPRDSNSSHKTYAETGFPRSPLITITIITIILVTIVLIIIRRIIRVPFFLLLGFHRATRKEKGTTGRPEGRFRV